MPHLYVGPTLVRCICFICRRHNYIWGFKLGADHLKPTCRHCGGLMVPDEGAVSAMERRKYKYVIPCRKCTMPIFCKSKLDMKMRVDRHVDVCVDCAIKTYD